MPITMPRGIGKSMTCPCRPNNARDRDIEGLEAAAPVAFYRP